MSMFSLRTIIDDILLIVRNNNISESEDLSRAQIASWVMSYRANLAKKQQDKDKETGSDTDNDDSLQSTIGPLELQDDIDEEHGQDGIVMNSCCFRRKRTVNKLPSLLGDSADNVISVSDRDGCVIQFMHDKRRHYHYFRRYTFGEPTCWFENGYLYVEGGGIDDLKYIYADVNLAEDPDADGEDDIKIPGWMIPDIRKAIMANELSFMLKRPSDDSNNSTLASVKPHGPQDQEE